MLFKKILTSFFILQMIIPTTFPKNFGTAYLIKVENKTNFNSKIIFPDSPELEKKVLPGSSLGEEPLEKLKGPGKAISELSPFLTGRNILKDKDGEDIEESKIERKPIISGHGETEIAGFDKHHALFLFPMLKNGAAWLASKNYSLSTTLSFKVFIQDKGEAIICFSQKEGTSFLMQIVLGKDDNTSSSIFINGSEVYSIKNSEFPFAKLKPGDFKDFWISLGLDGQILVGQGEPGENIFLVYKDKKTLDKIKRVGFSSNRFNVSYSKVKISPEVVASPHSKVFFQSEKLLKENIQLPSKSSGTIFISNYNSRVPLFLSLESSLDPSFIIKVKIEDKKITVFITKKASKNNIEILESKEFDISNLKNREMPWLSLEKDILIVGTGTYKSQSKKIAGIFKNNLLKKISHFKFSEENFLEKEHSKIFLTQATKFKSIVSSGYEEIPFSGMIKIITPYKYQFSQKGMAVLGTDLISNKSYSLGKVPQQDAFYSFTLKISKNGIPQLDWTLDPVNPKKFSMKMAAAAIRMAEGQLFFKADQIPDENASTIPQQLGLTFSNIGYALSGGAMRAGAGILEATLEHDFRHQKDIYVLQEKIKEKKIKKEIKKQESLDKKKLEEKLTILKNLDPKDRENFDFIVSGYQEIFKLIKSAFVISSKDAKTQIFNQLKELFLARGVLKSKKIEVTSWKEEKTLTLEFITSKILNLFKKAFENPFLLNEKISSDRKKKKELSEIIKILSKEYFSEKNKDLIVKKSPNFFFWTGQIIPKSKGSIELEIKAPSDFIVSLSSTKKLEIDQHEKVIQVFFGADDNQGIGIKTKATSDFSSFASSEDFPEASLGTIEYKKFWITVENEKIKVGQGKVGENIVLEFKDPYPEKETLFVGLSSPFSNAKIRNLIVSYKGKKEEEKESFNKKDKEKEALSKSDFLKLEKSLQEEDPLFMDLKKMDRYMFQDKLAYSSMQDNYDPLVYDKLEDETFYKTGFSQGKAFAEKEAQEQEILQKEEAINQETLEEEQEEDELRGALAKAQARGLAGIIAQASGEKSELSSIFQKGKLKQFRNLKDEVKQASMTKQDRFLVDEKTGKHLLDEDGNKVVSYIFKDKESQKLFKEVYLDKKYEENELDSPEEKERKRKKKQQLKEILKKAKEEGSVRAEKRSFIREVGEVIKDIKGREKEISKKKEEVDKMEREGKGGVVGLLKARIKMQRAKEGKDKGRRERKQDQEKKKANILKRAKEATKKKAASRIEEFSNKTKLEKAGVIGKGIGVSLTPGLSTLAGGSQDENIESIIQADIKKRV